MVSIGEWGEIKNGKKVSNKCFENLFVNEYLVAILQLTFNLVIVIYAVFYFIERYSALEIFA